MFNIKSTAVFILISVVFCASFAVAQKEKKKENPSEVRESLTGDAVADAMRTALGTDVALINAGSLGPDDPPDKITKDSLEDLIPFPGDIVLAVKLSGADISAALEKSVSALPRRFSGLLQVSGITFTCDLNKKSGSRVSNIKINGKALDPKAVYTVALTDFLSSGGNGFVSLKKGKLIEGKELTLGQIALKHVRVTDSLKKSVGSRIKIIELKKK